jgi:putative RecB family exonuclease
MAELPPYLSPSSAGAFDGCPRRWMFKYVERRPEPSGQAAIVGSFVHEVLEALCQLDPTERTQDRARILARERWPEVEVNPDYLALALEPDDARAFRWQAWLAVVGLWQLENPADVDVLATEQKVTAELAGVPFLGIIDRVDRIDGRLVISDYKSGTLPGARWRDDKMQQVLLYAGAFEQHAGEQPERARLLYLGQRILEVAVTTAKVEAASRQLADTWERIDAACATDRFDAKPGVLCGWCPFAADCVEGRAELARRQATGTLPAHAPARTLVA